MSNAQKKLERLKRLHGNAYELLLWMAMRLVPALLLLTLILPAGSILLLQVASERLGGHATPLPTFVQLYLFAAGFVALIVVGLVLGSVFQLVGVVLELSRYDDSVKKHESQMEKYSKPVSYVHWYNRIPVRGDTASVNVVVGNNQEPQIDGGTFDPPPDDNKGN